MLKGLSIIGRVAARVQKVMALGLALSLCLTTGLTEELLVDDWNSALMDFCYIIGERESFTDGALYAMEYLYNDLEVMGYSEDEGTLIVQDIPWPDQTTDEGEIPSLRNLSAIKKAANGDPSIIIVCAHYDSFLGTQAAKDNGSGVAALLTLARAMVDLPAYDDTELRFVFLDGEEKGELGSHAYAQALSEDERRRILAAFNVDLITVDFEDTDVALSINTLGGRTENGYQSGTPEKPMHNRASRALESALWAEGCFTPEERDSAFCAPRHWADGDHMAFDAIGVDAAAFCFQGNVAAGGAWPADMHMPADSYRDYDLERTQQALNILYRAVSSLAENHDYGLDP